MSDNDVSDGDMGDDIDDDNAEGVRGEGRLLSNTKNPVPDRVVVVETVYFQKSGEEPVSLSGGFTAMPTSGEYPVVVPVCRVQQVWIPLEKYASFLVGYHDLLLHVRCVKNKFDRTENNETAILIGKMLSDGTVGHDIIVPIGESCRVRITNPSEWYIKSTVNPTVGAIAFLPS